MNRLSGLCICCAFFYMAGSQVVAQTPVTVSKDDTLTRHGPAKGSLIIIGGGGSTPKIWGKFTELAGGRDNARIVVITAAAGDSAAYRTDALDLVRRETGIRHVTLLHTKSLKEANSEEFVKPLKEATGVYIVGGRQWRIADSYLNTLTHQALLDLLSRNGVIAGTSAGASIQGSLLWRGDTKGPHILVGDHTQGLGFLKNSVIDQHLLRRNRQFDLVEVVRQAPQLIGIGLDEATAVWVHGDSLEVIGRSYAAIYDHQTIANADKRTQAPVEREDYNTSRGPFFLLGEGGRYDLKNRKVVPVPRRERQPVVSDDQKKAP